MRAAFNELRTGPTLHNGNTDLSSDVASLAEAKVGRSDELVVATDPGLPAVGLTDRGVSLMRQQVAHGSDAVYVTRAVRHEAITMGHAVHVQNAVRSSQAEAQARDMRAVTVHSAMLGTAPVFDPFAFQAPRALDTERVVADTDADTKAATANSAATPVSEHTPSRTSPTLAAITNVHRPTAAPGFAAQLQRSANEFRARVPQVSAPHRAAADNASSTLPSVAARNPRVTAS
jgi:hypothetical protein